MGLGGRESRMAKVVFMERIINRALQRKRDVWRVLKDRQRFGQAELGQGKEGYNMGKSAGSKYVQHILGGWGATRVVQPGLYKICHWQGTWRLPILVQP